MTKELLKGNEAIAEAAVRAGLEAYFGYPITPQTELLEWLSKRMPDLGRTFLQAESELAAINMVYGAACTGKRGAGDYFRGGDDIAKTPTGHVVGFRKRTA